MTEDGAVVKRLSLAPEPEAPASDPGEQRPPEFFFLLPCRPDPPNPPVTTPPATDSHFMPCGVTYLMKSGIFENRAFFRKESIITFDHEWRAAKPNRNVVLLGRRSTRPPRLDGQQPANRLFRRLRLLKGRQRQLRQHSGYRYSGYYSPNQPVFVGGDTFKMWVNIQ